MFGGGFDVRNRAMSKEQRVRKMDWRVAIKMAGAIRASEATAVLEYWQMD